MIKVWIKEVWQRIWKDIWEYKWMGIVIIILYFVMQNIFGAFCPMLIISGLPCPGCGLTRAVTLTLCMEFERAYYLSPMVFAIIGFSAWVLICRYLLGRKVRGFYLGITILSVGLIGIYLYRMITIFPGYPPIVYRRNNIISNIIPYYETVIKSIWKF